MLYSFVCKLGQLQPLKGREKKDRLRPHYHRISKQQRKEEGLTPPHSFPLAFFGFGKRPFSFSPSPFLCAYIFRGTKKRRRETRNWRHQGFFCCQQQQQQQQRPAKKSLYGLSRCGSRASKGRCRRCVGKRNMKLFFLLLRTFLSGWKRDLERRDFFSSRLYLLAYTNETKLGWLLLLLLLLGCSSVSRGKSAAHNGCQSCYLIFRKLPSFLSCTLQFSCCHLSGQKRLFWRATKQWQIIVFIASYVSISSCLSFSLTIESPTRVINRHGRAATISTQYFSRPFCLLPLLLLLSHILLSLPKVATVHFIAKKAQNCAKVRALRNEEGEAAAAHTHIYWEGSSLERSKKEWIYRREEKLSRCCCCCLSLIESWAKNAVNKGLSISDSWFFIDYRIWRLFFARCWLFGKAELATMLVCQQQGGEEGGEERRILTKEKGEEGGERGGRFVWVPRFAIDKKNKKEKEERGERPKPKHDEKRARPVRSLERRN